MGSWEKELVLCIFTYWTKYGSGTVAHDSSFMLEVEFSDQLWEQFDAKVLEWARRGEFGFSLAVPLIDFHTAVTKSGRTKW